MRMRLAAVVLFCGVAFAGCGGGSGSQPVTMHGQVSLPVGTFSYNHPIHGDANPGDPCKADAGYDDIAPGGAVTVANGQGKTLATAGLSAGRYTPVTGVGITCVFSWTASVPKADTYAITVTHRRTLVYTAAEMAANKWAVNTTL